ncbi:MAG TPA: DUF692 family protein [Planctomycetes bacterium]|nr:DUF692 family protein [Planctomycetota bacterium]
MSLLGVGFSLHADREFLELTGPIIEEDADYFEVAPETLWRSGADDFEPNDYFDLFLGLKRRSGRPFTAHGLAFSLGSDPSESTEATRFERWLSGLASCHAAFEFEWFSDHLGWAFADGLNSVFPLPLPMTEEAVRRVAVRLDHIARIVPRVAFENGADAFRLGPPGLEASFWNGIMRHSGARMLLDLHNLYTESVNLGFDPENVLRGLDLSRVIQIHLSGGSESDPDWMLSGRRFRLDSHDNEIPEEVWCLFESVLPHCHGLRGVVVERLNGTVHSAEDVDGLRREIRRARDLLEARDLAAPRPPRPALPLPTGGGLSALQRHLIRHVPDSDSFPLLDVATFPELRHVDPEGYRLTTLIVRKLRFERLCLAHGEVARAFEAEPEALLELYGRFVRQVPPTAIFPSDDAQAWQAWRFAP